MTPLITVKGDPFARGQMLGSQARELIHRNVEYYIHLWSAYSNVDRATVLQKSAEFIPIIKEYDEDILQELMGIAKGSGAKLEEIVALNCRYEFVWAQMRYGPMASCTSAAACPEVTKTGHTIMGQNWDYKPMVKPNCIILEEIQEPDKPNLIIHTEAGIIGQKGLNSAGIGITVNALASDQDMFKPATPFWVLVRGALNQTTLDKAISAVTTPKRAVSGNIMLGQEGGQVIDIELAPKDFGFLFDQRGILYHANNFLDPRIGAKLMDSIKVIDPDTLLRTSRVSKLLERQAGATDAQALMEIFKDHLGRPNSICCHADVRQHIDLQSETIASVIFDLEDRSFLVTSGQPCSNNYEAVSTTSLSLS